MKKWIHKREQFSHINLLDEIRFYEKDFHNYLRMSEAKYSELLALVRRLLIFFTTVCRVVCGSSFTKFFFNLS